MRIRITPRVKGGIRPLEMLYGEPYPISRAEYQNGLMHIQGNERLLDTSFVATIFSTQVS